MESRRRKRQFLLFLIAILIPSILLVVLIVRLSRQEVELGEKRIAEQRRDALDQTRRELTARLEAIRLREVNRFLSDPTVASVRQLNSPTVFVAPLEQDRMVLPWDHQPPALPPSAAFTRHRLQGESMEFVGNDNEGALREYQQAVAAARLPAEKCAARLWVGRVLVKTGRTEDAARIYRGMLSDCEVTDNDGIAFGLYAAERLIEVQLDAPPAQLYLARKFQSNQWQAPVAAYLMQSLMGDASNPDLSAEIRDSEQIIALSRGLHASMFPSGFPSGVPSEPPWLAFGDDPWLVTVTSTGQMAVPVAIAVSSRQLAVPRVKLLAKHAADSTPIGEGFFNLEAQWPPGRFAPPPGSTASTYAAAFGLILAVALLAGYLLIRDVDREVRTADLRSHFVASVSHELKTPLTAIRMFAETLSMGRLSDERKKSEYLKTIVNESERLSRLVDNVLDFSRIERGSKTYQMEQTSLADVVRSAARAMDYPLAQLGFTLNVSIDDEFPSLEADADALQQAILNLLANAMKYSGDARCIDLRLGRAGGEAAIEVTDRGFGIAPEDQERIFEKFYRVRSAETDRVPGTGLGLTLAQHIVKAHGGRLEVSSSVGRGSTFSVRLPLHAAETS